MIKLSLASAAMAYYDERGEYSAADALRKLLCRGLSKQQRAALLLVRNKWVATPDICRELGVKPNHGATIMGDLHKLRLVVSRPRVGANGNEWIDRRTPIQDGE